MSQSALPARVCFVIPTYNEAPNITLLLRQLTELYAGADTLFLVVDDGSPDGTAQRVREFMAGAGGRVFLLEGQKRGLGDAYRRGMSHALAVLCADIIVQMDADFSHDPAAAARLLERIAAGADVAIGSRYVPGGALDKQWPLRRRLQSRCANLLARRAGGLHGVADCTAGFKAIKAGALRNASLESIHVKSYLFQPVLLSRLLRSGARVVEEPIHFRERRQGQTKLDLSEALRELWVLRHGSAQWTAAKFAVTGLSGVFVNLGSFHLLLNLGLHRFLASPLAILLSIFSNFLVNNFWTFNDRVVTGRLPARGLKYLFAALLSLLVSYVIFVAASVALPQVAPLLLQAAAIPAGALLNYLLSSRWIFRNEAGRNDDQGASSYIK